MEKNLEVYNGLFTKNTNNQHTQINERKREIRRQVPEKKFLNFKDVKGEFHRPFICSLGGHRESILKVKTHQSRPALIFSGAADGELKFWLTNERKCLKSLKAHEKFIRGLEIDCRGKFIISCADDYYLKLWEISEFNKDPKATFKSRKSVDSLSTHPTELIFACGGEDVLIWDQTYFKPIQKLHWGVSSISSLKFNPIEHNVIISSGSDRSIVIYDLRLHLPVKKFLMEMRSNAICWNHVISSEFTLASEDSNLYSFDLRNISQAKKVFKGHVSPVISLEQDSKTQDLLSGSLDNTIRIFPRSFKSNSEVFSTQRMNRVLDACFSADRKCVLSGSEDGNLRLWKRSFRFEKNLESTKGIHEENYIGFSYRNLKNSPVSNQNSVYLPRNVKRILKIREKISKNKKKKGIITEKHIGPGSFSFGFRLKKPIIKEFF